MLKLTLPDCRFCGNLWKPPPGADALRSYCSGCSEERRRRAAEHFGDDGKVEVAVGPYLIRVPRKHYPEVS